MYLTTFITKATSKDGTRRFVTTASDTEVDLEKQRCTLELFEDFIKNSQLRGNPMLTVAHYPYSRIGMHSKLFVDGSRFKMEGTFDTDNPRADAAFDSLLKDRNSGAKRIKTSVGFYPRGARLEKGNVLAYTKGWIEHNALTTAPANPRTEIELIQKGVGGTGKAHTMYEDALMIVGKEHADLLEKTYRERRYRRIGGLAFLPEGDGAGKKSEYMLDEVLGIIKSHVMFKEGEEVAATIPSHIPFVLSDIMDNDTVEASKAGRIALLEPETVSLLEGKTGLVEINDPAFLAVLKNLTLYFQVNGLPMGDLSLLDADALAEEVEKSGVRSQAYLEKMLELTSAGVPKKMMEEYHRAARAHAGGKMSPVKHYPSSSERIALARLSKEEVADLDDDELEEVHGRLHRLLTNAEED